MPEIGEVKRGKEIGIMKSPWTKFAWVACSGCRKERWIMLLHGKPAWNLCHSCESGKRVLEIKPLPADYRPKIGEIRRATEIGKHHQSIHIWAACGDCGKERWVTCRHGKAKNIRCVKCARKIESVNIRGENSRFWKGGRYKRPNGYIVLRLYPEDFYYSMAEKTGCILEHRLVMAKHLGRLLLKTEVVHHINGIRDDNRIENLELMSSRSGHNAVSRHCKDCELRKEIKLLSWQGKELRKEIRLLQFQVKELSGALQFKLQG